MKLSSPVSSFDGRILETPRSSIAFENHYRPSTLSLSLTRNVVPNIVSVLSRLSRLGNSENSGGSGYPPGNRFSVADFDLPLLVNRTCGIENRYRASCQFFLACDGSTRSDHMSEHRRAKRGRVGTGNGTETQVLLLVTDGRSPTVRVSARRYSLHRFTDRSSSHRFTDNI